MLDAYYNFLSDLSRAFLVIVSKNFEFRRVGYSPTILDLRLLVKNLLLFQRKRYLDKISDRVVRLR